MLNQPNTPALDFECHLPAGQMWFTANQVARHLGVSVQHIGDLASEGRFTFANVGPVDLAGKPGKTRATMRIPRACLVAFLQASKQNGRLFKHGFVPVYALPSYL